MVTNWHSGAGCRRVQANLKDYHDRFFLFRQSSIEGGISPLYPGIFIFNPMDGY
jgi:hypothetical protein